MSGDEPIEQPVLLQIGRLTFDVGDRPQRCGIHDTVIVNRRCADCDAAVDESVEAAVAAHETVGGDPSPAAVSEPEAQPQRSEAERLLDALDASVVRAALVSLVDACEHVEFVADDSRAFERADRALLLARRVLGRQP